MLGQPRDANGCFSRKHPMGRVSQTGTEGSCSLVSSCHVRRVPEQALSGQGAGIPVVGILDDDEG